MKVYVVWDNFGFKDLLEVFGSKEKAKAFKRKYIKENFDMEGDEEDDTIMIEEVEVK